MEYSEELVLGPLGPIQTPGWKRYVDGMICIVKRAQVDILPNHINQIDAHIRFTMQSPDSEGSIPFLDTNSFSPTLTTHTDRYLHWNSNHSTSAKRAFIQVLAHRARMVCFIPELLAKEMDFLHRVLHRNNYPDQFPKPPNTRPQVDQSIIQETPKEVFISVPYNPELCEEFRRIFRHQSTDNIERVTHTQIPTNAPQGQNSSSIVPGCSIPMDLSRRNL